MSLTINSANIAAKVFNDARDQLIQQTFDRLGEQLGGQPISPRAPGQAQESPRPIGGLGNAYKFPPGFGFDSATNNLTVSPEIAGEIRRIYEETGYFSLQTKFRDDNDSRVVIIKNGDRNTQIGESMSFDQWERLKGLFESGAIKSVNGAPVPRDAEAFIEMVI